MKTQEQNPELLVMAIGLILLVGFLIWLHLGKEQVSWDVKDWQKIEIVK